MPVAHAPARVDRAEREPQATAAGAVVGTGIRSAAARALVIGWALVVPQPEEPDQPHDQESHVEDPEPDHEKPSASRHSVILAPLKAQVKGGLPVYRREACRFF